MDATELDALEANLAAVGRSHREFFIPIVQALAALGGGARKRDVIAKLRELLRGQLSPQQLDYLENNNRFGWSRLMLKKHGVVDGERGQWELTEIGKAYAAAHAEDPLTIELDIPQATYPSRSTAVTESVEVSNFRGYEIPALSAMAEGLTAKSDILDHIEREVGNQLLPGDRRRMPNGIPVWKFRSAWTLSKLGKDGFGENIGTAEWTITNTGRERLASEREQWSIESFRGSKAQVQVEGNRQPPKPATSVPPGWAALSKDVPKVLCDRLQLRLRPDLGPSPDTPFARNLILYGPPGTGKTHIAKLIARALTGEDEVREDGRFRLVQFHPSYAYEDFVQGLRPDLKQTQLRYQLHQGPFLRAAEAASQEPDAFFVLVIDEVNRGDPARIFGELLYALEYRDEVVSLPLGGTLRVPSNLVVIGTMNSVDRSVALVDYALRRRFGFIRVDPDPEVITRVRGTGVLAEVGPMVLEGFNAWISARLGREHVLGHSFFLAPSISEAATDAFDRLWELDVAPLLEEYFFGDDGGLAEAEARWREIVTGELAALADIASDDSTEDAPR